MRRPQTLRNLNIFILLMPFVLEHICIRHAWIFRFYFFIKCRSASILRSSKRLRDLNRFEISLCFISRKVYLERLEARISEAAKKLKITQR